VSKANIETGVTNIGVKQEFWVNRDPIGEGGFMNWATGHWIPITANLLMFVGNNPISSIDPLGLTHADPQCVADCARQYAECIGNIGNWAEDVGVGAVGGLGYGHQTPTGQQRWLNRGGKMTGYGRGLSGGAGYGAGLGVLCLLTHCAAEEAGCNSGCNQLPDLPTPMFPYNTVNTPPSIVTGPVRF
jgi:hypothetical protein